MVLTQVHWMNFVKPTMWKVGWTIFISPVANHSLLLFWNTTVHFKWPQSKPDWKSVSSGSPFQSGLWKSPCLWSSAGLAFFARETGWCTCLCGVHQLEFSFLICIKLAVNPCWNKCGNWQCGFTAVLLEVKYTLPQIAYTGFPERLESLSEEGLTWRSFGLVWETGSDFP